jgi:hypothetical protein
MMQIEKSTDPTTLGLQPKESTQAQGYRVSARDDGYGRLPSWMQGIDEPTPVSVRGGWLCDEVNARP